MLWRRRHGAWRSAWRRIGILARRAGRAGRATPRRHTGSVTIPPYGIFPDGFMAHTHRDKTKLLNRVRRIRGQVDAIERALDGEDGCTEVLQLIAATRGAINGLMGEVIESHIHAHVAAPEGLSDAERATGANELVDVLRSYLK
jgi:DNA-binding FrmR family transcriptional regulator